MIYSKELSEELKNNIEEIQQIPIIPTLLNVICRTTGMGFAAVARVTDSNWVACSVQDEIGFGLKPGNELELTSTICNEIRQHKNPVIIDDVANDLMFYNHHTPARYGFRSYISVPIIQKDGSFFGTLCAIDPNPNILSTPAVSGMFFLFADLISFHLNAIEQLKASETRLKEERFLHQQSEAYHKNFANELEKQVKERTLQLIGKATALEKMNDELQSFNYVASHDLQEPLRKIRFFTDRILNTDVQNLSERSKGDFNKIQSATTRMHTLIHDLISYPETISDKRSFEVIDLKTIIDEVKTDLAEELIQGEASIETFGTCEIKIIPFQIRQLFHNLISNSIKFSKQGHPPVIMININPGKDKEPSNKIEHDDARFCHIRVSDNGIGFNQKYGEKIFDLFQRLHGREQYKGNGIGLTIVKKIIDNHNGFINVASEINEGTVFDIHLPMN